MTTFNFGGTVTYDYRMELFLNILLLVCFSDVSAYERAPVPQLDVKEEIVSVVEGEHVVLSCSVKNLGTRTVVWKYGHLQHPLTIGKLVFVDNSRISIDYQRIDVEKGEWNLHIHDVLQKDSGIFTCTITGSTILSRSVILEVKESAPAPKLDVKEKTASVVEGEHAVLSCLTEKLGTRTVEWRHKDTLLTVGTNRIVDDSRFSVEHQRTEMDKDEWNLHIRDVLPKESGMYTCTISGKVTNISKNVNLEVKGVIISGSKFVDVNSDIHLVCKFRMTESQEDLAVDWFFDGNRIFPSERAQVKGYMATETYVSELTIRSAELSDAGLYVCRSSNLDIASMRVLVIIGDLTTQGNPTSSTDMSDTSVSTTPLTTEAQSSEQISNGMLKKTRIEYYRERILTDRKRRQMMDLQAIYYRTVIDYIQKNGATDETKNIMGLMSP